MEFSCLNVDTRRFGGLEVLFPGWDGPNERLCVYSPHDDDALLGAGYAICAALESGAEVHLFIVCNGDCGYSTPQEKDTIVARRHAETLNCYRVLGIPEENIVFLNYPDFSAMSYVGRKITPEYEGHFRTTITELRSRRITRILAPNHYHEHEDHCAAYRMAAYDAPQAGDAHSVDWAVPYPVKSVAQYSVWAELSPEDALVKGRDERLRANTVLLAPPEAEDRICEGIVEYASQKAIIADLVQQRRARLLPDGRRIELYLRFDPRPTLSYEAYKELIGELNS